MVDGAGQHADVLLMAAGGGDGSVDPDELFQQGGVDVLPVHHLLQVTEPLADEAEGSLGRGCHERADPSPVGGLVRRLDHGGALRADERGGDVPELVLTGRVGELRLGVHRFTAPQPVHYVRETPSAVLRLGTQLEQPGGDGPDQPHDQSGDREDGGQENGALDEHLGPDLVRSLEAVCQQALRALQVQGRDLATDLLVGGIPTRERCRVAGLLLAEIIGRRSDH